MVEAVTVETLRVPNPKPFVLKILVSKFFEN
jgi:hypothetical protein